MEVCMTRSPATVMRATTGVGSGVGEGVGAGVGRGVNGAVSVTGGSGETGGEAEKPQAHRPKRNSARRKRIDLLKCFLSL
jgi:hypothetical protein